MSLVPAVLLGPKWYLPYTNV